MIQYKNNKIFMTAAVVVLLSVAIVGCKGKGESVDNDSSRCTDGTAVEAPDNLVDYFDSLLRYTPAFIYARNVDDIEPNPDSLEVLESIKALDDYQAHRRSDYPREQVADALGTLIFSQWHNATHCCDDDMAGSETFFFRYLEQVARLCPHVDYLTSIHTGDDMAGIFTGHEFSQGCQPYYCILLYRHGSGYRTKFLQHYVGYNKIWALSDSAGRNYLLCYNGNTDEYFGPTEFKAILFMEGEDGYEAVCSSEEWLDWEDYIEGTICIDYNPRTHIWTQCRRQGNVRIPVAGRKRLRLVMEGRGSRFEMVD